MESALLIVGVALLVLYLSWLLFHRHRLNLPPGPTPWPIIGSLHLLGTHPFKSLADLAQKHGPLMSIQLGQKYCVVATSAEAAKEFLKHQDANFSSRPRVRSAEIILPKDIVFQDLTPVIRHLRKLLVRELTSTKCLDASQHIRAQELHHMLHTISATTGPIQVKTYLHTMSTNILTRMILGKRFLEGDGDSAHSEIREFKEIGKEFPLCFGAIHLQDVFEFVPRWFDPQGLDKRFGRLKARLDAFHARMMAEHRAERRRRPVGEAEETLLDVLLGELENPEQGVTEEHVLGVIWDALTAGTDTTAQTSEWALAEVLRNPALTKRAQSELHAVVGPTRTVLESDLPNLKLLQAIVKETLRLHPTVPLLVPHQSTHPTTALGYEIPAKTRLFVNVWGLGRDPTVWEDPLEFRPERFLEGKHVDTDFQGRQFELIPFGAGRRQCPGMAFGVVAVHLAVASLLHAFEWGATEGVDVREGYGLALPMAKPLVLVAQPKLPLWLFEPV